MAECDHILTYSGGRFYFAKPWLSDFTILDIAHGLSNVCRFGGQAESFYSVAEHSVHVSRVVPAEHALAGLLHDAAEAFLGDVTRPLKALLPDYKKIERDAEQAIFRRFGLPDQLPDAVKEADWSVYATERRILMHPSVAALPRQEAHIQPAEIWIRRWAPGEARAAFVGRFNELAAGMAAAPTPSQGKNHA